MTKRSLKGTKVTTLAGLVRSYVGNFWDEDVVAASDRDNPVALSLFKDLIDDALFRVLDSLIHLTTPATDFVAFDSSDAITNAGAVYTVNREFYAIVNGTLYKVNTGSDTLVDTIVLEDNGTEDGMYKTLDIADGASGSGVVDLGDILWQKDVFYHDLENNKLLIDADIIPITDEQPDLGSTTKSFQDAYIKRISFDDGTTFLDDYEEGNHVATVTASTSGTATIDTSFNTLAYEKLGNHIHVHGEIRITSVSSPVGYVDVSLPFSCGDLTQMGGRSIPAVHLRYVVAANMSDFVGLLIEGESAVRIYLGDGVDFQSDSAQELQALTRITLSISYRE